jgi:hypothetical protein
MRRYWRHHQSYHWHRVQELGFPQYTSLGHGTTCVDQGR